MRAVLAHPDPIHLHGQHGRRALAHTGVVVEVVLGQALGAGGGIALGTPADGALLALEGQC